MGDGGAADAGERQRVPPCSAHNNYDQAVFSIITRGDNRMYFVSETGVLTILCAWVLAAILYIRAMQQTKHL